MHRRRQIPSGNAGVSDLSSLRLSLSYYDVALAVLPIPLLVGFLAEELLSLTPGLGTSVGAAVSALAVAYLLFGNPPIRRGPSKSRDLSKGRGSSTNRGQPEGIDEPSA